MGSALEILGAFHRHESATLLARVVGADGANITPADIESASYTVYRLDPDDPDSQTAVTGHQDVDVAPASLLFAELQLDAVWGDTDGTGYNLRHELDVSADEAFAAVGEYRVVFRLVPTSGQVIGVRFRAAAT